MKVSLNRFVLKETLQYIAYITIHMATKAYMNLNNPTQTYLSLHRTT